MNKKLVYCLVTVLAFIAFMPVLKAEEEKKEITVTGTIELQDEENENSPLVIIDEDAEKAYVIVNDEKGKELKKLVGKMVKITGVVGENDKKEATLTVKKSEEIKADEDAE